MNPTSIVLDAGAVMNINYLPSFENPIYIPTSVLDEIRSSIAKSILEMLLSRERFTVMDPSASSVKQIRSVAAKMGQGDLSIVDIDVLAVALDVGEVMVISDDYGLRNVAHELNIQSEGISTSGGNQKREYGYTCRACGSTYEYFLDECDICGHTNFKRYRRN